MPSCLTSGESIPMSLNQLALDPSKDAFLVKVPQEGSPASVYFFIENEEAISKLTKCPFTAKNEYFSMRISTLSEAHYSALIESCTGDERPHGTTLEAAWSKLPVVNWSETKQFQQRDKSGRIVIDDRDFSNQVTYNTILPNASAKRCNFTNVTLEGANLEGSDFTGSNFTNAKIVHSRAINADFTNANLSSTIFDGTSLMGACFFGVTVDTNTSFKGTMYADFPTDYFKSIRKTAKQTAIVLLERYIEKNSQDTYAQAITRQLKGRAEPEDGSSFKTVCKLHESKKPKMPFLQEMRYRFSHEILPKTEIDNILDFSLMHPMISDSTAPPAPTASSAPVVS